MPTDDLSNERILLMILHWCDHKWCKSECWAYLCDGL